MGIPYEHGDELDVRELDLVVLQNTTVDSLTTTGTIDAGATTVDSLTTTGNISIGGGLISNSIVSVGTGWVDIPATQARGAYLILARSESDNDSALVASVADASDAGAGYVNVMARVGDIVSGHYLAMQYPASSNVQIKMNAGSSRNVSITVIRA